jgi:hypothetical protein
MVSIRARARSTVGLLVAYVAAVVAGLSSLVPDSGLAFFWPAAGVGALWMLSARDRGHLLVDACLLWASTAVADVLMDVPLRSAVLFGLANLLIGLTLRAGSALSEARASPGAFHGGCRARVIWQPSSSPPWPQPWSALRSG